MSEAESKMLAWDMYFSSVAGIQYHPANPPESRLSVPALAAIVDSMIEERAKRCRLFGLQE